MMGLEETHQGDQYLMQSDIFNANTITRIGTWNIRTLYQYGKLAQLLREVDNYRLDILGIREMRWTGSNKMTSEGKTIIYSGHNDQHVSGVGLVLNEHAAKALIRWKPVNDRIITTRFQSWHAKAMVIQVYAPMEGMEEVDKRAFYDQLQDTIMEIPNYDIILLIGDFNAQIGGDWDSLNHVIGPHGAGLETNDNGEQLLLLCNLNNLCISNTYFAQKAIHKKTWCSPNSNTWNEIDYICISRRWRAAIYNTWVQ